MFVGHAMVAFAIAAAVGARFGLPRERALALGFAAGAFATVPDVDMSYAVFGLVKTSTTGVFDAAETFWASSTLVHRVVTHSLVVGFVAAIGVAAWSRADAGDWWAYPVTGLVFAGLLVAAFATTGLLGGAVMLAFVVAALAVTTAMRRLAGLSGSVLFATALLGFLSHPFGDLFTGSAPHLLYPLDMTVLAGRVTLHPDPTVHLVCAFLVELTTIWLALWVYLSLDGRSPVAYLNQRATLGGGYAAAAFLLPAPTLDTSYHFVFSVLALGVVGVRPRRPTRWSITEPNLLETLVTGLAAITIAVVGYTAVYLAL
ncbi:metal-dependent hydrolase [Haladaptatus sp. GCM10025707]|uniref:metal-dependent hydrolase n=1 Tax=unclassified Haladaptatus TaxID=2622732 RepID=UPI0023E7A18C|nr:MULTISPECIES: metal-dependent hydrolase [unclassified Haladaptatus]